MMKNMNEERFKVPQKADHVNGSLFSDTVQM